MKIQKQQSLLLMFSIVFFLMPGCTHNYIESKGLMEIPFSTLTRSYVSKIGNKALVFRISDEFIKQQQSWSPDNPLSIPADKIAVIAKSELTKYTDNPNSWQIQTISVDRINYSTRDKDLEKWVYIVTFRKGSESEFINLPIGFNRQPIQGVFQ